MVNKEKQFISTTELAHKLGVSRVTIFNRIKQGKIPAQKVGRNFVIRVEDVPEIGGKQLGVLNKQVIEGAVKKTVDEYGETLRLLGKE